MKDEGSWAHKSLSAVADFAMEMNPIANTRSVASGNNWQGEQQNRGSAMLGLITMGASGRVNQVARGGVSVLGKYPSMDLSVKN